MQFEYLISFHPNFLRSWEKCRGFKSFFSCVGMTTRPAVKMPWASDVGLSQTWQLSAIVLQLLVVYYVNVSLVVTALS